MRYLCFIHFAVAYFAKTTHNQVTVTEHTSGSAEKVWTGGRTLLSSSLVVVMIVSKWMKVFSLIRNCFLLRVCRHNTTRSAHSQMEPKAANMTCVIESA